MASLWIRELTGYNSSSNNVRGMWKAMAIFLWKCCGYTQPSPFQQIATTGSWFSFKETGTTGAFTGTAVAEGNIATIASASHVEGQQVTIDDGWNTPTTFTYTATPTLDTDINITGAVADTVMRDRLITAIHLVRDNAGTLEVDASIGASVSADITNHRYGTRGNVSSWTKDVVDAGYIITQPTGGLDGWVLTDAGATFTNLAAGNFVCVVDATNAVNNGVFRIIQVISATQVELDFRADDNNGEAFTAASGLTWFGWGAGFEIPATDGDWFRLNSPHATTWGIEMTRSAWSTTVEMDIRVAVDGDWTGSKMLSGKETGFDDSVGSTVLCMEVDTGGEYLNYWANSVPGTQANLAGNTANGFIVCDVTAIEPDRLPIERIALFGPEAVTFWQQTWMKRFNTTIASTNTSDIGSGRVWDDGVQVQRRCYFVGVSHNFSTDGFNGDYLKEANHRLANRTAGEPPWDVPRNEVFDGSLIIQDPDHTSTVFGFEFVGWAKGHLTARWLDKWSTNSNNRYNVQCSQGGGSGNKIYVFDGFVFGWPDGITYMSNF